MSRCPRAGEVVLGKLATLEVDARVAKVILLRRGLGKLKPLITQVVSAIGISESQDP